LVDARENANVDAKWWLQNQPKQFYVDGIHKLRPNGKSALTRKAVL
jgi:hypothetical protein